MVLNLINHLRFISAHWNPLGSLKKKKLSGFIIRNSHTISRGKLILGVLKAPGVTLICRHGVQIRHLNKQI